MQENLSKKDLMVQLLGWVLFVICSLLFTLAGVRAQDSLTIAGSVTFFLACLVFIIPLVKAIRNDDQLE